jgi:N-acetylmuramoyl-L-alanine amidase
VPAIVYRVQVGAFRQEENAEALVRQLKAKGFDPVVSQREGLYRVQIGAYRDRAAADRLIEDLRSHRYRDVFVVQEVLTSPK